MDYKKFYLAIRRYRKGRISRSGFINDWKYAQQSQGVSPADLRKTNKRKAAS